MIMVAQVPWPDALRAALARRERAVLVAVASAAGSTPREAGAAMVVTATGLAGTIGGGHLEYEALRLAREALAAADRTPAQWLVRFPLAARLGQCCGGVATLAFATLDERALPWLDAVAACTHAEVPFAVVGPVGHGEACAGRVVVTSDAERGTLGDAVLDRAARDHGRARLAALPGDKGSGSGVVETAGTTLFVHVVRPATFPVWVFGNGHVGRALVQVLAALPAAVTWIDTREHDFPAESPTNVEVVATDDPPAEVRRAPRGAYVVVMTHSHALDFDILGAALARDDWRYLGVIGSQAKRRQFEQRLVARGASQEAIGRVVCPIGSGGPRGKEPGVIAVAVAAELLAVREAAVRVPRTTAVAR